MSILREYHNQIKFELLNKYCKANDVLIDIGTGRGGDMHKWNKCELQNVIGLDVSKEYIKDAISRFYNSKYLTNRNYKFYYYDKNKDFSSILEIKQQDTRADVITCMFALHYIFKTKSNVTRFLNNVLYYLKKDGIFIVIVPKGDNIVKLLGNLDTFENKEMKIIKAFNNISSFGAKYEFFMTNTLYFGDSFVSQEYLVFEHVLIKMCEDIGLKLIQSSCFSEIHECHLTQDEKVASRINHAYVFKKL